MQPERCSEDEGPSALVPYLVSVAKSTRQLLQLSLTEVGIAVGQDSFLLAFGREEAPAVIDLALALSVRASTVSKMVDILERKGWVVRERDDRDLRKVRVRLTPEGLEARRKVIEIWTELETELRRAAAEDAIDLAAVHRLDDALSRRLSRRR